MDILQSHLVAQGKAFPPPHGPRSQGESDVVALEAQKRLHDLPIMRMGHLDGLALSLRPQSAALVAVATFSDRDVLVHTEERVADFVMQWLANLKSDFQLMRLHNKRTWPEFLDALYSGEYRASDCEIIHFLRGAYITNARVFADALGDAPLTTGVVAGGQVVPVGSLCTITDYIECDRDSMIQAAKNLFINVKCSDAVLKSKIVTRTRAVSVFNAET